MIHLQGFLPETNTSAGGQNSATVPQPSELDSFHGALSEAVSSTLEKFGMNSSDVKISITRADAAAPAPEINAGNTGNAPVRSTPPAPGTPAGTASTPASAAPSTTASSSSSPQTPADSDDPNLDALFGGSSTSAPAASTPQPAPARSSTTAQDAQEAFDNAYWASQPAAVQALRNMQDPEQRTALATQLASEGYSIDVPIMVWGWDPSIVTSMREADGYTWVPSALQNPVEVAPGLPSVGSLAAYDPNNPPAGSIMVSST